MDQSCSMQLRKAKRKFRGRFGKGYSVKWTTEGGNDRNRRYLTTDPYVKGRMLHHFNKRMKHWAQSTAVALRALDQRLDKLTSHFEDMQKSLDKLGTVMTTSGQVDEDVNPPSTADEQNITLDNLRREDTIVMTDKTSENTATKSEGSKIITSGKNLTPYDNVRIITLNSEEDFPYGTWLGDPQKVDMRVRCQIPEYDMVHNVTTCKTPEKCALRLLDYLFDRETQAESNLSGSSKHNKKQLDPLMIYGIRCHLTYHYHITAKDWYRIRRNIDSKCRAAFRRKHQGLSMAVKQFSSKSVVGKWTKKPESPIDNLQQPEMIHVQDLDGTLFHITPSTRANNVISVEGMDCTQVQVGNSKSQFLIQVKEPEGPTKSDAIPVDQTPLIDEQFFIVQETMLSSETTAENNH